MFTKKENYNELLKVKKINFDWLDGDTLIDWELIRFKNNDNIDDDSWVCLEVWKDENNTIKILEQDDTETEEISKELDKNILNHIHKLVYEAMEV